MARSYPVVLRVAGKRVVVVGGGPVAASKAAALAVSGAEVHMVAPRFCPEALAVEAVRHRRPYRRGDLHGAWLVVTALERGDGTDATEVTAAVAADAAAAQVWCNAADRPAYCTVTLPAVHRDGDVTVAVSTEGRSPATASWLRDRIALQLGDLPAVAIRHVAGARARIRLVRSSEGIDWRALLDTIARRPGRATGEVERFVAATTAGLTGTGPGEGCAVTDVTTVITVTDGGGDPDELTLRAARALATADVVVHDHVSAAVLALVPDSAELVDVGPAGGDAGLVEALLARLSVQPRAVVRLHAAHAFPPGPARQPDSSTTVPL